jgi:glucose/mannose-6-phosphate isomerase
MMKNLIEAFPQHISEAMEQAKAVTFKLPQRDIKNIVICGLGGSGVGAKIVCNWLLDELKLPVTVSTEYALPAYANQHTLVIGTSYSGNTEETMTAIQEAQILGCHIIGICSGGQLAAFCEANVYNCCIVPSGLPPRAGLAFSMVQLLNLFVELGFCKAEHLLSMANAAATLSADLQVIQQRAQELAAFLHGKVGVYYAETKYEGVLVRARQQFNENAKYLGWHHTIPEMNHNELVSWGGGAARFAPVFFSSGDLHPNNQKRLEITMAAIEKKAGEIFVLETKGATFIERSLYYIHLVDWASFYLADLNGADIMDMQIVDYLKGELAKLS